MADPTDLKQLRKWLVEQQNQLVMELGKEQKLVQERLVSATAQVGIRSFLATQQADR